MWATATDAARAASLENITVSDAWSPPRLSGSHVGVAFATFHNQSSEDITLRSLSTPLAKTVEIHTHNLSDDGVMRMQKLDSLTIPAGGSVTLKPGGLHLMLMDLDQNVTAEDHFPITLQDASSMKRFIVNVRQNNPLSSPPALDNAAGTD